MRHEWSGTGMSVVMDSGLLAMLAPGMTQPFHRNSP